MTHRKAAWLALVALLVWSAHAGAQKFSSRTLGVRVDVLVTEEIRAVLDSRFRLRALPPVPVKGIAEPVATFAVEGFEADFTG